MSDEQTGVEVSPQPQVEVAADEIPRSHWLKRTILLAVLGVAIFLVSGAAGFGPAKNVTGRLFALAASLWGGGSADPKAGQAGGNRPIPVVVATATPGTMPIYLTGLGTVAAFNTATIRTRVDGEIKEVTFVEGQLVHKNDVLFEIDPRPFKVQLTQAEGQRAKDEAAVKNAQLDVARYEAAGDAISKQILATAQATVAQLEGALKTDQGQIDAANLQLTYCHILAPFTGQIGLKQVDVGNTVHASDSGGLAVITQLEPITVKFNLPQADLRRIPASFWKSLSQGPQTPTSGPALDAKSATTQPRQVGASSSNGPAAPIAASQPARQSPTTQMSGDSRPKPLTVEAYSSNRMIRLATGTLLAIDNQIDLGSGTVQLKAIFENTDRALYPNQFINARLLIDTRRNAVLIPTAAVQRGGNSQSTDATAGGSGSQSFFVYVVKDDTVDLRPIKVGPAEGDLTLAEDGLAAGEVVVTDGVDKLVPGTKVIPAWQNGGAAGAGRRSATQPATGPASQPVVEKPSNPRGPR